MRLAEHEAEISDLESKLDRVRATCIYTCMYMYIHALRKLHCTCHVHALRVMYIHVHALRKLHVQAVHKLHD